MDSVSYCITCNNKFDGMVDICKMCGSRKMMKFNDVRAEYSVSDKYLIRIKNEKILNELKSGLLYCNSPLVYHDYLGAGKQAIQDQVDGAVFKRKLTEDERNMLKAYGYKFSSIENADIIFFDDLNKYRIYCFYAISTDSEGNVLRNIDEKIREFGDSFIVINIHEYKKRIKESLPENIYFELAPIKYVDYEQYDGVLDITCKDMGKYMYQYEYRFIFYSDSFIGNEPYILNLSHLEDPSSKVFGIDKLFEIRNIKELGIVI